MIAFEVRRNGQLLCTAGHADIAALTARVNYISDHKEFDVMVGGITEGTQNPSEHLRWASLQSLSLGDEVSIKIVDVPTCDPPVSVKLAKP